MLVQVGKLPSELSPTAADGSDFVGITRVIEFPPNVSLPALTLSGPITIVVLDDSVLEDNEDFVCEIANVSHPQMLVGRQGKIFITILDEDGEQHCEEWEGCNCLCHVVQHGGGYRGLPTTAEHFSD